MPQTIQTVECKWPRHNHLGEDLRGHRPRSEASREHRGFQVQAERGREQVADAVEVESAGEGDAGDAIQRGGDPGDLPFVDGEMGRDGPAQALLDEDFFGGIVVFICR